MTTSMDRATAAPGQVTAMIASPLEPEHATAIAATFPDRVELIYRPDLMPPMRYVADHHGDPARLRTPAQQREWHALLARAEVLWDFAAKEDQGPLALSPNLRWVQTTSAGVGQYVMDLGLQGSDIVVTTASGIHARPLTEFVFAVLLFHTKRLAHLQAEQRAHHWERYCPRELTGQVMAIVGPGRIGREIARIGRCFGMTVWATARDHDPARAGTLGADRLFARDDLREMLAGADCVVLCVPHTPETEGMIGRVELEVLKPDAILVNIARGVVIDEDALIDTPREGRIGLAALDVFCTEPFPPDSPLWDMPNVLINPHSASTADSKNANLTKRFITNMGHYLTGDYDQMAPILGKSAVVLTGGVNKRLVSRFAS